MTALASALGLEAIYPKPKLSKANPEHKKYPYLLKNLVIDYPDQVWCADLTYIRMLQGFVSSGRPSLILIAKSGQI